MGIEFPERNISSARDTFCNGNVKTVKGRNMLGAEKRLIKL